MGQIGRWVDPPCFGGETPKCKETGLEEFRLASLGFAGQSDTKPDRRSHLCTLMGSVVAERRERLRPDLSSSLAFQDAAPRQFKKQCPEVTVVVQSSFWDVEIPRCFPEYFLKRYGKMCQRGKLKKKRWSSGHGNVTIGGVPTEYISSLSGMG